MESTKYANFSLLIRSRLQSGCSVLPSKHGVGIVVKKDQHPQQPRDQLASLSIVRPARNDLHQVPAMPPARSITPTIAPITIVNANTRSRFSSISAFQRCNSIVSPIARIKWPCEVMHGAREQTDQHGKHNSTCGNRQHDGNQRREQTQPTVRVSFHGVADQTKFSTCLSTRLLPSNRTVDLQSRVVDTVAPVGRQVRDSTGENRHGAGALLRQNERCGLRFRRVATDATAARDRWRRRVS